MASGLIGTSTATSANVLVTGPTLSYTCPASGVRYAVVSISASVSVSTASNGGNAYAHAGILSVQAAGPSADLVDSLHYSVIVGPGGTWSGATQAYFGAGSVQLATLTASVLEVV